MLDKIESIKRALENHCYMPALSLALTLPDICGQIEYPSFTINGQRQVGRQYITWFDEWVNHNYADPSGWTVDGKKAKKAYFTGKMCYDLRCSFLHSGNSDIHDFNEKEDKENRYSYKFELSINGADSFGTTCDSFQYSTNKLLKQRTVRINIITLCYNLCLSAELYYYQKGSLYFKEHKINLLDLNEESTNADFKNVIKDIRIPMSIEYIEYLGCAIYSFTYYEGIIVDILSCVDDNFRNLYYRKLSLSSGQLKNEFKKRINISSNIYKEKLQECFNDFSYLISKRNRLVHAQPIAGEILLYQADTDKNIHDFIWEKKDIKTFIFEIEEKQKYAAALLDLLTVKR